MATGKSGQGEHGGQDGKTEALVTLRARKGRHGLPETVDRPTIVALRLVGHAQEVMRYRVHDAISAGSGKGERALSGSDGLVIRAHHVEME
jgi:hypothetical protein